MVHPLHQGVAKPVPVRKELLSFYLHRLWTAAPSAATSTCSPTRRKGCSLHDAAQDSIGVLSGSPADQTPKDLTTAVLMMSNVNLGVGAHDRVAPGRYRPGAPTD